MTPQQHFAVYVRLMSFLMLLVTLSNMAILGFTYYSASQCDPAAKAYCLTPTALETATCVGLLLLTLALYVLAKPLARIFTARI